MSWKIKKIDLLVIIMLLLPDQFFYLINKGTFKSIARINYDDFVLVAFVCFFIYVISKYGLRFPKRKFKSKKLFYLSVPLALIAAFVPATMFGQSFSAGFLVQRTFFILPIVYLTFRTLLLSEAISKERLLQLIYVIGVITTILCVLQYFTYGMGIRFLSATFRTRNGLRIRSNFAYPIIVIILSFNTILSSSGKNKKFKAMLILALELFFEVFVMQTRLEIIGIAAVLIVMVFLQRENISRRLSWLMILGIAGFTFLFSQYGELLLQGLIEFNDASDLRSLGRAYYLEKLSHNPIWGYGYPHESSTAAETAAGYYVYNSWGYGLDDNGIFGFSYIYGLLGTIWCVWVYIRNIVLSLKARKLFISEYYPYFIYLAVIMINLLYWYWNITCLLVFCIMVALLEHDIFDRG